MDPKTPHPIDVHVGNRIRLRRKLINMTQEQLARSLGITFQQVQKYERGSNRVSASRLFQIAEILDVTVTFFFDDWDNQPIGAQNEKSLFRDERSLTMLSYFDRIRDEKVRDQLVSLARTLANESQSSNAEAS